MAERNGYGGGSMLERSPGVWRLRVMGTDAAGRPTRIDRTFRGSKTVARAELSRLATAAKAGTESGPSATFSELLDAWLDMVEPARRPRTMAEHRREVETRIRPRLGQAKLSKLTAHDLDTAYRTWRSEGLSDSSIRRHHAVISAALTQGVKWGWIASNPAQRSSAPPQRRIELTPPSPGQLELLYRLALDTDPVMAVAVALAALTGARRGELVALRWSDIDLDVGLVHIRRSLTETDHEVHEGPTKTHQIRHVALDPRAVGILAGHQQWQLDLSDRADSPVVDDPFVLSYNANGATHVKPDRITNQFVGLCRRAARQTGEPFRFRFHDLRHFAATQLVAAGVDIKSVSGRLGHATATMTLDRYAHALTAQDRVAAVVLGRMLPNPQDTILDPAT